MNKQPIMLQVSDTIGQVSAEYIVPGDARCIMTLAHGAGAGMNHPFMITLASLLANVGIATLRFNFPFIENKKKRADVPAVAHKTIEVAIMHAHNTYPALPLFVSGKSFGGRMTSQYLALHPSSTVKGIVFYGFPLHPADKPSIERAEHLKDAKAPMLFLQGTRDALATINMMEEVCSNLAAATLIKIEGADHAFKAGKQDIMKVLVDNTSSWSRGVVKM
jgi:uncharacterized protein